MTYKKSKDLAGGTVQYEITISKDEVQKAYDAEVTRQIKSVKVEGFRPGKAPKELAEKELNKDDVYTKALNAVLPIYLDEIIQKDELKIITTPRLKLTAAKEGEDWTVEATFIMKPKVKLPDYKKKIQALKKDSQKSDLWKPGDSLEKQPDEEKQKADSQLLNSILEILLKDSTVELSEVLVGEEYDRKLAGVVDELRKIGLTTEAYLKSKNMTLTQMQEKIRKEVEETFTLEFVLEELTDIENIIVDQADFDRLLSTVTDPERQKEIQANAYYYAGLMRRQKLFEHLMSL